VDASADTSTQYKTIEYWTELAQLLERGLFDGLFIADIVGVYDVYQNSVDVPLKESIQLPVNDPLLLVSAMAAVTRNLGFGLTANLTYEAAVPVRPAHVDARSPEPWSGGLEHRHRLPRQRRQGHGPEEQVEHDRRYDQADEYLEVLYKLWEGSWEDDAVINDRKQRIYAQPEKGAQGRAQRRVLSGRGLSPLRAVAATHAGAVPGRQFGSRLAVRRAPCRVRVHQWPEQGHRPRSRWTRSAPALSPPGAIPRTSRCSWD
jgi:alkanesulfonate monooxygenase SsuD/methylene tetrahydromethanopterin reductase-like flavin-dependent oxidoreductase (luciferase family)